MCDGASCFYSELSEKFKVLGAHAKWFPCKVHATCALRTMSSEQVWVFGRRLVDSPFVKIQQRGVQWKQGAVICML